MGITAKVDSLHPPNAPFQTHSRQALMSPCPIAASIPSVGWKCSGSTSILAH